MSNFSFITDSPAWFLLLCLFGGLFYAGLLYWANPKNRFSKSTTRLLFFLRFVVVSFLLALLLSPYLLRLKKETDQPVILLAHDNTQSVTLTKDSVYYTNTYPIRLDSLVDKLNSQYTTVGYLFGQEVVEGYTPDFQGQQTDMAMLFNRLESTWQNKNIGALVLFSDGLYNRGINPLYVSRNFNFPIITVPLGDTTHRPDLSIHDLRYNRVVYRQSEFPVEVTLSAYQAQGEIARLSLWHNNEIINEHKVNITSESFSKSVVFSIEPSGTGQHRYSVEIDAIPLETNLTNNQRDFYVDVIQEKQRVMLLAASPHPDLGAIQSVLQDYYDVELKYARQTSTIDQQYSLIIVHQLPTNTNDYRKVDELMKSDPDLPFLFITGNQTNLQLFNSLQTGLNIQAAGKQQMIDAFPAIEQSFSVFTLEQHQRDRINRFPPLLVHFGEYKLVVSASNLLKQKIRGVETDLPLINLLTDGQGRKIGFITGTGIWRWRLNDFSQNGNHETYNTLVSKIIDYLLIRLDNRPLRVFTETEFLMNEEIRFVAELYNPSLELVNEPELSMVIVNNDDGKQYLFSFQTGEENYLLNAGRLPEGSYSYRAETELGGEQHTYTGNFRVLMGSLEARNTVADHELLFGLSRQTNGIMVYPDQMMSIPDLLARDERIVAVTNYNKRFEPLIGFGWLFALITGLLFIEWLIRKINGAY